VATHRAPAKKIQKNMETFHTLRKIKWKRIHNNSNRVSKKAAAGQESNQFAGVQRKTHICI